MGNLGRAETYVLSGDERRDPILWRGRKPIPSLLRMMTTDQELTKVFGDLKTTTKRLGLWGHDADKVHFIAVRNGLPLHNDKGYARYSHQLMIRNNGYGIQGIQPIPEAQAEPPYGPGSFFCLDTWSPHRVPRDPRLEEDGKRGTWYIALVYDTDEPLTMADAWPHLANYTGPAEAAATAAPTWKE